MEINIQLPFFPGFDDEASYSLYEYPDPEDRAIEEIMYSIEEMGLDELITERDLYFDQDRYEAAAKSAWIEEWKKQAPKNVVKSVIAESGGRFNANYAYAHVTLVDGWQDVMSAFMQDNETWLKEDCGLEEDFDNWPKYLFEDQDEERIADMIGFMMLQDNDEIRMDLIGEVFNKVSADSYVFLDEWRLGKLLDEPDEEMRVLNNVKKWYNALAADDSAGDDFNSSILDSILDFVRDKYECEWYKNYLGTKKITFDGPTNYKETGEITHEDISDFMSGAWNNFLTHRLIVGHTERQDRFTAFIRDYPLEILDWLKDSLPYTFYKGLAEGGEYELFGCSQDEFIEYLNDYYFNNLDEKRVFEYAAVLEEKYGIDYAVEYFKALYWLYWYCQDLNDDSGTAVFIIELLSRAASLSDNAELEEDIRHLGNLALTRKDGRFGLDFSIEMYARLADMWKKGLIGDDWLVDKDCDDGLAWQIDNEWGDRWWDEDHYPDPECPDEYYMRVWLIKLLESDFANDIADYLKPLLEMVLQKEKDHNWETGKKAIESFLAKTSNK